MINTFFKHSAFILIFFFTCLLAVAQKVTEPPNAPSEWSKPFQAFRVAGNLYYVGTYDLACYLIATPQGHMLINTGLAASTPIIRANVEALGFKFSDIKILLTTQAHYDHLGAMAEIKRLTGAQMMVNSKDSGSTADGGKSDYAFGGDNSTFEPIKIDRTLRNGDTIKLGGMNVVMLHHPGHTKGSSSFLFDVRDNQRSFRVLIANMPTIVTERSFSDIPAYPGIANDYAYTLDALKKLSFDIWLSSHASQFGLHEKRKPGDNYNPPVFADRKGYDKAIDELEKQFIKKVKGK